MQIRAFQKGFNFSQDGPGNRPPADPKKYAPGGVYIMLIHGTFVNFLDLSPAIRNDIITRLIPAPPAAEVII